MGIAVVVVGLHAHDKQGHMSVQHDLKGQFS